MQEYLLKYTMEHLGGFFHDVLTTFVDWTLTTWLGPFLESCLKTGTSAYNNMLNSALDIMTKSPEEWNADGWSFIVNTVNETFVIFASALIVVFFLIGFCAESIDVRREMNIKAMIKSFIKLGIAEYFVVNSINIVTGLFGLIDDLTSFRNKQEFQGKFTFDVSIDVTTDDLLTIGNGPALLAVVVSFVCMVALIISGAIITYTAYMRFFKILILIPYGAIASATMAGNHMVSNTAVSFWKYAIGTVLEGVTMILALCLFGIIDGGGGLSFVALTGDFEIIGKLIDKTLLALLCLGTVKGSGALIQKALSL